MISSFFRCSSLLRAIAICNCSSSSEVFAGASSSSPFSAIRAITPFPLQPISTSPLPSLLPDPADLFIVSVLSAVLSLLGQPLLVLQQIHNFVCQITNENSLKLMNLQLDRNKRWSVARTIRFGRKIFSSLFARISSCSKMSGILSTNPIEIPIVILKVLEGFDVEYLLFDLAQNLKRVELRIKVLQHFLKILWSSITFELFDLQTLLIFRRKIVRISFVSNYNIVRKAYSPSHFHWWWDTGRGWGSCRRVSNFCPNRSVASRWWPSLRLPSATFPFILNFPVNSSPSHR